MSFRQPTSTIIRLFHFKGSTYEFPVESVLQFDQGGGQLRIEASTGYLLTTLANTTPQHLQTLTYERQADGSWLARGVVRLQADGPSLISGTVILHDPLGERAVLLVTVEAFLSISGSAVAFNNTEPGKETFAILKISQQGSNTPIMLSIDDSNRFTLAANRNEVNFTPTLTITPSFGGTCIYIRYTPNRIGQHSAQLFVTTPYDTQTILLVGQSGDQTAWYRLSRWVTVTSRSGIWISELWTRRVQLWVAPTILLLSGILYMGYVNQCELIPSMCQSYRTAKKETRSQNTVLLAPITPMVEIGKKLTIEKAPNKYKAKITVYKNYKYASKVGEAKILPVADIATRKLLNQVDQLAKLCPKQTKRQVLVKRRSIKKDEESDLEKELNETKTYRP